MTHFSVEESTQIESWLRNQTTRQFSFRDADNVEYVFERYAWMNNDGNQQVGWVGSSTTSGDNLAVAFDGVGLYRVEANGTGGAYTIIEVPANAAPDPRWCTTLDRYGTPQVVEVMPLGRGDCPRVRIDVPGEPPQWQVMAGNPREYITRDDLDRMMRDMYRYGPARAPGTYLPAPLKPKKKGVPKEKPDQGNFRPPVIGT